jgi:hypothetical protein
MQYLKVMFFDGVSVDNGRMELSKLKQLRRQNLNALIEGMGGQSEFINKTGMNQGQVSLLQNGKKLMGEDLARAIEAKAGWASGSLDSAEPADPLDRIEAAIQAAHWLTSAEMENFIGLLRSMRESR